MNMIKLKDWVREAHKVKELHDATLKAYCSGNGYPHASLFMTIELHDKHLAIEVRAYDCCPATNAGARRELTYEELNCAPVNILARNAEFALRDLKRSVISNIDNAV